MGRTSDFQLTASEHHQLISARLDAKKAKDHELQKRIRAVILLGKQGKTRVEVAEICEASVSSVYGWLRRYRSEGISGLRDNYKPKQCSLTAEQQEQLSERVKAGPEASGIDAGIWTAALIGEQIKNWYGVVYSVSGVTKLLHRLGFTVQLPKVRLARADPKAQKIWLEKTYPAILRRARKEGGVVFFSGTNASSSSPVHAHKPGL